MGDSVIVYLKISCMHESLTFFQPSPIKSPMLDKHKRKNSRACGLSFIRRTFQSIFQNQDALNPILCRRPSEGLGLG